jgi:hypothetical protein
MRRTADDGKKAWMVLGPYLLLAVISIPIWPVLKLVHLLNAKIKRANSN